MAVLDFGRTVWEGALGDTLGGVPDVLILEGTWWRERATEQRLGRLASVRELPFPDMFAGEFDGARVAYCCAYGAARAVEPAHVFAQLGTPLVIQIGTCGVMTDDFGAGTVAVPRKAEARDGVSPHYGAAASVGFDTGWAGRAEEILTELGVAARDTRHLTWPSLFAQSDAMCAGWAAEGLQTVDMEAAAVAAVAARFGASAIALLSAWDALSQGRTFLDPLPEAQQEALRHADLPRRSRQRCGWRGEISGRRG